MRYPSFPFIKGSRGSFLYLLLFCSLAWGQSYGWTNQDFETGNLNGWAVTLNQPGIITLPTAMVVAPGPAPNTNGALNMVHGGNWSAQLYSGNGKGDPDRDFARIEQSDTVPAATPWISFWFAAVLNGIHYSSTPPAAYGTDSYVLVEVIVAGSTVYSQRFSWYDNSNQLVNDGVFLWKHLPWTQYYYDMSAYVGQTATIRYTAFECGQGGHNCYGYLDDAEWLPTSLVPPTPTPTSTGTITPVVTATPTITFTPTITPTFTPTCVPRVWPDPFNPKYAVDNVLKIGCVIPGGRVTIYTLSGEKVWYTEQASYQYESPFTATWDGKNDKRVPVTSGVYFYVIEAGGKVLQRGKFLVINSP